MEWYDISLEQRHYYRQYAAHCTYTFYHTSFIALHNNSNTLIEHLLLLFPLFLPVLFLCNGWNNYVLSDQSKTALMSPLFILCCYLWLNTSLEILKNWSPFLKGLMNPNFVAQWISTEKAETHSPQTDKVKRKILKEMRHDNLKPCMQRG